MGDISYSFMRILIRRQIKKEVEELIAVRKAEAAALYSDPSNIADPQLAEKLLVLSLKLDSECKEIALNVLNKYPKEVEADSKLSDYKKELIKRGT